MWYVQNDIFLRLWTLTVEPNICVDYAAAAFSVTGKLLRIKLASK